MVGILFCIARYVQPLPIVVIEFPLTQLRRKVTVTNTATGEVFEDKADILIPARGQLNEVNWPDLPGLDKFQGKLLHSAEWDDR